MTTSKSSNGLLSNLQPALIHITSTTPKLSFYNGEEEAEAANSSVSFELYASYFSTKYRRGDVGISTGVDLEASLQSGLHIKTLHIMNLSKSNSSCCGRRFW